jgi:hypothetical protein
VCCVYVFPSGFPNSNDTVHLGHYRLWVNGIHHGDISFNNLMYDVPTEAGDPVGVVIDFDLATWVDHPTTNNDRTGTIPFMAYDLLSGGLERRIPRLYRHDMESFVWVLTYITVAIKEYQGCTVQISPQGSAALWFKDGNKADRNAHVTSKENFGWGYGAGRHKVSGRYKRYVDVIRQILLYWAGFHRDRQPVADDDDPNPTTDERQVTLDTPEEDNPAGSLRVFIETVERSLGASGSPGEGFAEVKSLLLEAIETPAVAVK